MAESGDPIHAMKWLNLLQWCNFLEKKFQIVADNNGVMSHIGMRRRKRQFFSCAFELKRQLLHLVAISSPTSFYAAGEIGEWKPDAI